MDNDPLKKQQEKAQKRAELAALPEISLEQLEEAVRKWMIVPDKGIIKLLCAHYITNKFARKAVWLMLIAPSGGGKTELLNGLLFMPDIEPISMLTPNTFLSGMPGPKDSSLLPKITGKIMLFKDWTTIISMQKDAKAEIMSQFREIWDGSMKKPFGNGKIAVWEGKVSILAASTQAIDMSHQQYTHLGERFLFYRIDMPNRKEAAHRALNNDAAQNQMTWEIQKAFYAFFKGIDLSGEQTFPPLSKEIQDELVDLSDFCTMARSGVIRDMGFKKEVIFVPSAEMPTRIVQQLNSIIAACTVCNKDKGFMQKDLDIVYKIALDSIPQTNRMVIMEMARADEQTTKEIALSLGYPTGPIRMYLENLSLLGVCSRIKGSDSEEGGAADKWTMKPGFVSIIRKYEHIEALTEEEKKKRELESIPADDPDFDVFKTPSGEQIPDDFSGTTLV